MRSPKGSRRSRRSSCVGAGSPSIECSRWTRTRRLHISRECSRSRRRPTTRPKASPPSPRSVHRSGRVADMAGPSSGAGGDVHDWGPLVGDLKARRDRAFAMGGPQLVERQHSLGKLTVRERLDLLLDPGSWIEYALLADHMDAGLGDRYLAADGAVTGIGEIDGRAVAVAAYDFTVMAGSMGAVGEAKISRLRAHAVRQRMPFVWLLDSAGARIQSTSGSSFAGAGALFREQVAMSGVVPMVAAMLGHCAAGTAYIPGLADFVPMVKGTSSMALGGRHLVKAAVGEDVNAADKAARFVWLCDAFNIPIVFLHDVPGFIVGSAVEKQGIIRHGAKMLFAVSEATVPKISVVLRKSYGAGYFVMNGLAYEADYIVAWPTAEIAVMGPDGAVNIIHRRQLAAIEDDEERTRRRLELAEEIRANIDPYIAAGHARLDDVIDPAETRRAIWRGLTITADKRVERPWRKHGVLPV